MRFAVHGPGFPVAFPRSHGVPRRDVSGRIQISVAGETAGRAHEARLALARLRIHVPACRASLTGERGTYLLHPAGRLVLQSAYQQPPARCHDLAVEPGFLADIPAWIPGRAPGRARHGSELEILDSDHVKPARDVGGDLLAQSLRASASRARSRAMASFTLPRRFDPGRARASLRWRRLSRFLRRPLNLGAVSNSPVDRAALTAIPRSMPTVCPFPGLAIGLGIAVKATCQRPARSRVIR